MGGQQQTWYTSGRRWTRSRSSRISTCQDSSWSSSRQPTATPSPTPGPTAASRWCWCSRGSSHTTSSPSMSPPACWSLCPGSASGLTTAQSPPESPLASPPCSPCQHRSVSVSIPFINSHSWSWFRLLESIGVCHPSPTPRLLTSGATPASSSCLARSWSLPSWTTPRDLTRGKAN